MREHYSVMQSLLKVPDQLLGSITYIPNTKVLKYVDQIRQLIEEIDKEYKDKVSSA